MRNTPEIEGFEDHVWRDLIPAETFEIYRSYQRPPKPAHKVALLAIDLFACTFPDADIPLREAVRIDPRSCGEHAWRAMPKISSLLELAREHEWPVFYTVSAKSSGAPSTRATMRSQDGVPSVTADGTPAFAVHRRFAPVEGDVVIEKPRASAFFGTDLADRLNARGIDTVVVCGESTSGCVRASVVEAYSHRFNVLVVEDAVFDRSPISHQAALFDLHHKYAEVIEEGALAARVGARHAGAAR